MPVNALNGVRRKESALPQSFSSQTNVFLLFNSIVLVRYIHFRRSVWRLPSWLHGFHSRINPSCLWSNAWIQLFCPIWYFANRWRSWQIRSWHHFYRFMKKCFNMNVCCMIYLDIQNEPSSLDERISALCGAFIVAIGGWNAIQLLWLKCTLIWNNCLTTAIFHSFGIALLFRRFELQPSCGWVGVCWWGVR